MYITLRIVSVCLLLSVFHVQASDSQTSPSLADIQTWVFRSDSGIVATPVVAKKAIYVGTLKGDFYSLDAGKGAEKWHVSLPGPIRSDAVTTKAGVLVATASELFYFSYNGQLRWNVQYEEPDSTTQIDPWDYFLSAPVLNKQTVFIGTHAGRIVGINLESGKPFYSCGPEKPSPIRVAPVVSGDLIYAGNYEGVFFACNITSGDVVWQYDTKADGTFTWRNAVQREALLWRSSVCFAGRSCRLYCLDKRTGKRNWTYASPSDQWLIGKPALLKQQLVLGSSDQHLLLAFDVVNGHRLWEADTAGRTWGKPLLTKKYVFAVNRALQKFDRQSGALVAAVDLPKVNEDRHFGDYLDTPSYSHSDVVAYKNSLLFSADDGTVYSVPVNWPEVTKAKAN